MLMINHHPWLADKRMGGTNDAIEHVHIASARKRISRVKRLVKTSQVNKELPPKNHITASAQHGRAIRIGREPRKNSAKTHRLEMSPETSHLFEEHLGFGVQFQG